MAYRRTEETQITRKVSNSSRVAELIFGIGHLESKSGQFAAIYSGLSPQERRFVCQLDSSGYSLIVVFRGPNVIERCHSRSIRSTI